MGDIASDPRHSPEQSRMAKWYRERLSKNGQSCGFGLDKRGEAFVAPYAQIAWEAWQEAQRTPLTPAERSAVEAALSTARNLLGEAQVFIDATGKAPKFSARIEAFMGEKSATITRMLERK